MGRRQDTQPTDSAYGRSWSRSPILEACLPTGMSRLLPLPGVGAARRLRRWSFLFVRGRPHTDWLPETIQRDGHGFILTGSDLQPADAATAVLARSPLLLESSMPEGVSLPVTCPMGR